MVTRATQRGWFWSRAALELRRLSGLLALQNRFWATVLANNALASAGFRRVGASGNLVAAELDLELWTTDAYVLSVYPQTHELCTRAGFRIGHQGDRLMAYRRDGLCFVLEQRMDVVVAHEIFVDGVYAFTFPQGCVVVDIGMNVGYAALYFATLPHVVQVIGYEPFPATFRQACHNVNANPRLANRISLVNAGVGSTNASVEAHFDYARKEGMSASAAPGRQPDGGSARHGESVRVHLEDCVEVVAGVRRSFPDRPIVLKIDCEGAEYEIVERLTSQEEALAGVAALILEWHERGPEELTGCLREAGFATVSRRPFGPETGMVYAFRTSGVAPAAAGPS